MSVYYNEFDPSAAEWLRNLIAAGLLPPGDVDTRSIVDVQPSDLERYAQCHFFAGIGGWAYALDLAQWPRERPIWTGSCPCQPFSVAGRRGGEDDARHLWPHFFRLVAACRPPVVMGEQVAGALGMAWFDGVAFDLALEDYASRAVDIPACAVDAPHIRNRLYWIAVADTVCERRDASTQAGIRGGEGKGAHDQRPPSEFAGSDAGSLVDADGERREEVWGERAGFRGRWHTSTGADESSSLANAGYSEGRRIVAEQGQDRRDEFGSRLPAQDRPNGSFWSGAEWIICHDGKARRTKPGVPLLVDGLPNFLAALCGRLITEAREAVIDCTTPDLDGTEILSLVRDAISQEAFRIGETGVLQQLVAPEVLLSFLQHVLPARDGAADSSGRTEAGGGQGAPDRLPSVWSEQRYRAASRGREPVQQRPGQPPIAVQSLSLILARHAAAHREATEQADAAARMTGKPKFNRVAQWRGLGNAIVPPLAAEVIKAFLEAEELDRIFAAVAGRRA